MIFYVKKALIYLAILPLIFLLFCSYQNANTKSEKLGKIYIINLDKSVDRYKKIKTQLDNLNLDIPYTRFSAIEGKKSKFINTNTKEVIIAQEAFINRESLKGSFDIMCSEQYSGDFDKVKMDLKKFYPRTLGEIGVACSHKKIWQEIVNNGYKNTLVLEDDMNFIPGFKEHLSQLMNNLPKDYEYIYLFAMRIEGKTKKYSDSKKLNKLINSLIKYKDKIDYKLVQRVRGKRVVAAGYIISEQGAKKLLENFKKYETVDHYIRNFIENEKLISYETKTYLVDGCFTNDTPDCDTTIGHFIPEKNLDISNEID